MTQSLPLSQQVILITGASAGIGKALAIILAVQYPGIRLILAARRREKLEEVASKCRQTGADTLVISTDMSDLVQVKALAEEGVRHFGRVDALINNAGYGQMGPIELMPLEVAQKQFTVNFYAPLLLSQTLIPVMRNQGSGKIINISSLGGKMAFPAGGLYSCSKFALEALSDVLRMELKGFNIQVSVIEPGPVITEFFQVAWQEVLQIIPNPETTLYQPTFDKIEAIERQLQLLGWTPEKVAKIIVKSLTDKSPRSRYLAATGGSIFVPIMTKIMPTWFTDAFWKKFYGIDKVEKAWKEKFTPNI